MSIHEFEYDDIVGVDQLDDFRLCIACFSSHHDDRRNIRLVRFVHSIFPDCPLVVIADSENRGDVVAAFEAGASSYISTGSTPEFVATVLQFVLDGGTYFPLSALRRVDQDDDPKGRSTLSRLPRGLRPISLASSNGDALQDKAKNTGEDVHREQDHGLTDRQRDVLFGLKVGNSNKQIARDLGMSEATVKVHVRQVMRKLRVSNRTQAALVASSEANEQGPLTPNIAPLSERDGSYLDAHHERLRA